METQKLTLKKKTTLAPGDRVQYMGQTYAAYYGQAGEVKGSLKDGLVVVLLDGAQNPVSLPEGELTPASDVNTADRQALMTSKQPRFRYIANTCGGQLTIPDLRSDTEPDGLTFAPGEKADLLQFNTPEQINRARSLIRLAETKSEMTGLPMITVLKSMDDSLPEGAVVQPWASTLAAGQVVTDVRNIYDDKLDEVIEKEHARNEKLKAGSLARRKSAQHGQASKHIGRG